MTRIGTCYPCATFAAEARVSTRADRHHHHAHPHLAAPTPTRRDVLSFLVSAAVFSPWALGQQQKQTPSEMAELYHRRSADYEKDGLAEPFKGITTDGHIIPDLFDINSTGISTATVRSAAEQFITALSPVQLARSLYPVDDVEWRKWMNQHFYSRQGVCFAEMSDAQREAAFALLRASLSPRGFELIRNIMRLNETLAELSGDHDFLGEWLYYMQIYGRPSATEPWGWKLEGHHAIISYFVLGDQVVMTPLFIGSEPVSATSGKYKGLEILQQEQNDGLGMLLSLKPEHRKQAILNFSKTGNNNLTEAFKDNVQIAYAGLRTNDLGTPARVRFRELIQLYVSNLDDGHTRVKMNEVDRHLDNTWFTWIGGAEPDSVFYYRIQSPVILIEFDHQRPANLRDLAAEPNKPTRQHVHCVVRTPNGNDYGKDLLRLHYLDHPHTT